MTKKRKGDPVSRKRIMIVDDHPLVILGISLLIKEAPDFELAATVGSVPEAMQAIDKEPPDLVLLDISLSDRNGIELLKDLQARHPKLSVLVLSMHEESVYAERALRAGAKGYIMKCEPAEKILAAIRCVLNDGFYVSPSIASRMLRLFVTGKDKTASRSAIDTLSDRELQILTHLGNGLASPEIADMLHLSVKTVQTYREHIKRKLGLTNSAELTHYATLWVNFEK